jgi:hypothetical protein
MPAIGAGAEPDRDLWPAVLRKLDEGAGQQFKPARLQWAWYDWAVLGGIVAVVAIVPESISVLLYYL